MKTLFLFLLSLLFGFQLQAQTVGLWQVTKVQVGGQTPTPTAKWFDLKANGQMLSGNGGIINQRGSWKLKDNKITFFEPDGTADPAGPFTMQIAEDKMTLERDEEGMHVIVSLESVQEIPMASWDHLLGGWRIKEIWAGDEDVTNQKDPEKKYNLYIRWDHYFVARNTLEGQTSQAGLWQIHGHRPELRLQGFDSESFNEWWRILEIDQSRMVLESMDKADVMKLVFGR